MIKFAGFRVAAPSRPIAASACLCGLGLLACGKILGVNFDVVPEQTANTGEGIGLTSAGGTADRSRTSTAGDDGGTGNRPHGLEGSGGQRGDAAADAATDAGGTQVIPAMDDSASTTDLGPTNTMGGTGGEAGSHNALDGSSGETNGYNATDGRGGQIGDPGTGQCSRTATFTSIEKVRGISGAAALAHYSHDELQVYYAAPIGSTLTIVRATRPTLDDAFGTAEPVAPLNQLGFVASPSLTADGLTVYVDNPGTGEFRIYSATRDALEEEFPVPTIVSEIVADTGFEGGPFVSASGDDLYFHSTRNGNSELFRVPSRA